MKPDLPATIDVLQPVPVPEGSLLWAFTARMVVTSKGRYCVTLVGNLTGIVASATGKHPIPALMHALVRLSARTERARKAPAAK